MTDVRIGIAGCTGRMGQMLVRQVGMTEGAVVSGGLEVRGSEALGRDLGTIAGLDPLGVIVTDDKVYLRMVLAEDKEKKGLQFVAAVPEGTKVKILKGGDDPQAILKSAAEALVESLDQAGDAEPLVALLSNCCARGGRLREFRQGDECEIQGAIMPAISDRTDVPIFGFYAWGELGPIAGPFGGLRCMYQQHTFVSAVLTEIE